MGCFGHNAMQHANSVHHKSLSIFMFKYTYLGSEVQLVMFKLFKSAVKSEIKLCLTWLLTFFFVAETEGEATILEP